MATGRIDMIGAMGQRAVRLDHVARRGKRHIAAIGSGAVALGGNANDQS